MGKEELILKTKQKLDEINDKIIDVKKKVEKSTDESIRKKSEKVLNELEDLNEEIQKQYSKLGTLEDQNKTHVTEMEKNIYNSIESFDSAFQRAGSIFNTH